MSATSPYHARCSNFRAERLVGAQLNKPNRLVHEFSSSSLRVGYLMLSRSKA